MKYKIQIIINCRQILISNNKMIIYKMKQKIQIIKIILILTNKMCIIINNIYKIMIKQIQINKINKLQIQINRIMKKQIIMMIIIVRMKKKII